MTQRELVARIAKRSGCTKVSVEVFLAAFCEIIADELARGEAVRLRRFGTFLPVVWGHTRWWHAAQRKILTTDALVVPRFRPGKPLRDLIAQRLTAVQLPNGRFIIRPREPEESEKR